MFEITMAGPAKNALGTEMMEFLLERIGEAAGRPILLTGTGDSFSAGLDLKEVAALDARGMEAFLRLLERMVSTLYSYPAPVVGLDQRPRHRRRLHPDALLRSPGRAARDVGAIGLNEVALGLRFPPRIMAIVRNRVPRQHIERVLLGAELFDPPAALALGMLDDGGGRPRGGRARAGPARELRPRRLCRRQGGPARRRLRRRR